jgi:ankyrin repeat protein
MSADSDLFLALRAGDVAAVRAALAVDPARALARDPDGVSLLMTALYHRHGEMIELLLGLVSALDSFECAALGRTTDLIGIVSKAPSTLTSRSPDGFTLLHLAAYFGHTDVVERLLRYGAPVDAVSANPSVVRPLHSAVAAGSVRVVQILLTAGAEIDAPQRGGWTALHGAAQRGDADMVELLLRHGANAEVRSDDGRTPIDLAREQGHEAIAARLVRR